MAHTVPPARSWPPRSAGAWLVAALVALVASACVPPVTPGDPDPTTSTTSAPAGCARDTSLPQPGDVTVNLGITGKVVLPNGQPSRATGRLAVVKDRRSNVGAVLAEASVNDAGFFLLNASQSTVPADLSCRDYRIEVCSPSSNGCAGASTLHAERDVTDLVTGAAGLGRQEVDISDDPLVWEVVG